MNDLLVLSREMMLQGKSPHQNLERQVHPERLSQDLPTCSKSGWNHKLVATLQWWLWWIARCWVWGKVRVRNSWRLNSQRGPYIFMGFASNIPPSSQSEEPRKIPFCGRRRRRVIMKNDQSILHTKASFQGIRLYQNIIALDGRAFLTVQPPVLFLSHPKLEKIYTTGEILWRSQPWDIGPPELEV